jgi:hypothetical protein
MMPLVGTILPTSLIVALVLAVVALLHRRSAALRHWVLTMGLVGAALTPVLGPIAPDWGVDIVLPSVGEELLAFGHFNHLDKTIPEDQLAALLR